MDEQRGLLVAIGRWAALLAAPFLLLGLYIHWNDRRLRTIPEAALYFSPKRVTPEGARATAARMEEEERSETAVMEEVPPRTGRRYIIVGGGGFLGAWIAAKLLERGEDPHCIRLLDIHPPTNHVVKDALAAGVQFVKVDVTDAAALTAAFIAPWPRLPVEIESIPPPGLTVFHTAANIRFYERHQAFIERSRRVNVAGTRNVIKAAQEAGASVLIYTSSGSVGVKRTRFLLWPWENEPPRFVQVINDDDARLPQRHEEFFSNYAATKIEAEGLVRAADRAPTTNTTTSPSTGTSREEGILRTGCIRPGNGIFGPRGDMLCGAYLVRQHNPTWIEPVVQSFVYVENCVVAHLLYEARLLGLSATHSTNPDIGGQAFCIADPGPAPTYGDVYQTLETLTDDETQFPSFSPTLMLLISFAIEGYYRLHFYLTTQHWSAHLVRHLPEIKGDIINLQPALFQLTCVHLIFDDSRARLPPSKGGLGYKGKWTTLEGLVKTVEEHKSGIGRSETRSGTAGVSFGFKRKKKAEKVVAKGKEGLVPDAIPLVTPVEVITAQ